MYTLNSVPRKVQRKILTSNALYTQHTTLHNLSTNINNVIRLSQQNLHSQSSSIHLKNAEQHRRPIRYTINQLAHRQLHTKYNSTVTSSFTTKYNTRPDGTSYGDTSKNADSTKNSSSYNGNIKPGQGKSDTIFMSRHTKLERQEVVSYLNRKHIAFREQADKVIVRDCPFCKPTQNRIDNQFKLAIFDSGGINCVRCSTQGSYYDLKRFLGDIPQITDIAGSPSVNPLANSNQGTFYQQSNPTSHGLTGFSPSNGSNNRNNSNFTNNSTSTSSQVNPAFLAHRQDNDAASKAPYLNQEATEQYSRDLLKFPEVISYLTGDGPGQRGLHLQVLQFYKVGVKIHSFPSNSSTANNMTWVQHPCITFPWARLSVINSSTPPPIVAKLFSQNQTQSTTSKSIDDTLTIPIDPDVVVEGNTKSKSKTKITTEEDSIVDAEVVTPDTTTTSPAPWNPPIVEYDRIKLRSIIEKHQQRLLPAGGEWGLFGWHTVPVDSKVLVITEGEFDAMAVYQATGLPAVSLPNGASSLPVQLLPCLERFEKIILWMDNDKPGQDGAQSFVQKLGVQRCLIVDPDADQFPIPFTPTELEEIDKGGMVTQKAPKDANDALRAGLNLNHIIDSASPCSHKQIAMFKSFRSEVKRMFTDPKSHQGVLMSAMPQLMALMKGHRRGELTIITGATGVGKTTILSQLSLEVCMQGVPTLWGSFEIRNPRLARTMMLQYAAKEGVPLTLNNHVNFDIVADRFQHLPMHFLRFYGSSPVEEVIDAMDYAVYVHDVQHVILDNLQFMLSGQTGRHAGDKFDIQDKAIEAFRQFASQRNVHVTLVIHPRKEADNSSIGLSSVFGSAKATQEADNVLIIQAGLPKSITKTLGIDKGKKSTSQKPDLSQHGGFDDPITGEIVNTYFRTLELRKNRWDGDQGAVSLRFDKSSLRLYELTKVDIDTGLMTFIEKQRQFKQLDLLRHMSQIDQGEKADGFRNMPVDNTIGQKNEVHSTGKISRDAKFEASKKVTAPASFTPPTPTAAVSGMSPSQPAADSTPRLHEPSIDFIID